MIALHKVSTAVDFYVMRMPYGLIQNFLGYKILFTIPETSH